MEDMEIVIVEPHRIVLHDFLTGDVIVLWSDPDVIDLSAERESRRGAE